MAGDTSPTPRKDGLRGLLTRLFEDRRQPDPAKAIDHTPYGHDLAAQVAEHLRSSDQAAMVRNHADYSGQGFFRDAKTGEITLSESQGGLAYGPPHHSFLREADFTDWLAQQNDYSLSGHAREGSSSFRNNPGNQRITRQFLTDCLRSDRGSMDQSSTDGSTA